MKLFIVVVGALLAVLCGASAEDNVCFVKAEAACGSSDNAVECNANFSGFATNVTHLQVYANDQLATSFDYLMLATNFGTYVKNRPGFQKEFRALSDKAWNNAIDLIKYVTKRGSKHDFNRRRPQSVVATIQGKNQSVLELNEYTSLALALDVEKRLSEEAHTIHRIYSHANHKAWYDAEVAHYLEEEFIEYQAKTIRKLSGYVNDVAHFIEGKDSSLALHLFDEYLVKQ